MHERLGLIKYDIGTYKEQNMPTAYGVYFTEGVIQPVAEEYLNPYSIKPEGYAIEASTWESFQRITSVDPAVVKTKRNNNPDY